MSINLPLVSPSPSYDWPLAVYILDLAALVSFLLVLLAALYALISLIRTRAHFFNVFWGLKMLQCVMAIGWVVGLTLGEVWVLHAFGVYLNNTVVCAPVMVATFGLAQPIFLSILLFITHLQLTNLVARYRLGTVSLGYQMVADAQTGCVSGDPVACAEPPKQLDGVRRRVSESVLFKASVAIFVPILVQAAAVPLSMWVADNRNRLTLQRQLTGENVATPVACYQDWFEFFFQACAQFHASTGGPLPVCRFSLTATLGYVGTAVVFFLLFSHAAIAARRQMFNRTVRRAFRRFQVLMSLTLLGGAALRLSVFMFEYEDIGEYWLPDLLTSCANLCDSTFLLTVVLAVLRS